MSSQANEERRFSEELDRLLAGGEVVGGDNELSFARQMMELRASPSDNFKTGLRERLLLEMVRREVAGVQHVSRWGRFKNALMHDAVARTAGVVAAVALVMLVFGGLWQIGVFGGRGGTILTQPLPNEPIVGSTAPGGRTISVDRSVAASGYSVYLSQIVIGASETQVYAVTPSGMATGPRPPAAEAEYDFDSSAPIAAGPATSERSAIGSTTHIWTIAAPPEGAVELTFSITSVGDTPGPWTFVISLRQ